MIQTFTIGQPLVLVCLAESEFDSKIQYSWTKNGRTFNANGVTVFQESSQNGNIIFTSPDMSDVGTYQCEAKNKFGEVFSQASLLRAKQPRNQPRSFFVDPVAAQVLVDPIAEDKESIERKPITQAVPEILPSIAQPVFVVYPKTRQDDPEQALILDMEIMDDEEVTTEEN